MRPSPLDSGQVHVWRIPLWPIPDDLEVRYQRLEPKDRERADRFIPVASRQQHILSHFAQDRLLESYLGKQRPPFQKAAHGKPYFEGEALQFNLSHSHRMALLAVGYCPLGVDVEYTGRKVEYQSLAERFFSRPEAEQFARLEPQEQAETFFTIWTRKEAYIKALGEGLSHPLDAFQVSLEQANPYLTNCPGWSLYELEMPPAYRGALVTRGEVEVRAFDFQE